MFLEKYYTDHHDVDENRTTIPFIGGDYSWYRLTSTGKFSMELESDGLEPHDLVASKKNNAQPPSFTRRLCHVLFYNFT